ncbi:Uncharacterised protein [uncultured archaeon]|nr:Uncharacterised protein [uncultured archaeon]
MRLFAYVMILSNFYGNNFDVFDILESYRIKDDEKSLRAVKSNFPRDSPIPYLNLDRSYLLRKYQDRHNYNRATKICQKGLEVRLKNKEIKRKKAQREKGIKDSFSRK